MAVWTCPDCRRKFGAAGQGHLCQPGLTVVEFIDVSPGFTGPVFERVQSALRPGGRMILTVEPGDPRRFKPIEPHARRVRDPS